MNKKEIVTQNDLFSILDLMDKTGIQYWLDGGWGVDALVGKQTRVHRDVDIDFDSSYTEQLLQKLHEHGYEVITDWSPVRVELYHPNLSYIDIHPFILSDDGTAKQADAEGGWYEFEADYFGYTFFEGRRISCISAKGQMIFHTGYELREVDKHDIKNIEKMLGSSV
jgi:lincosamide nucleotidyltransferase A/C/D/E